MKDPLIQVNSLGEKSNLKIKHPRILTLQAKNYL